MKTLLQIPAQIVDFRPRADRSYKLTFETREMSGDDVSLLVDNFQGEGWLLFKPQGGGITTDEIPASDAKSGLKTPSQRLRNVIFILWQQRGKKGDFDAYYKTTLEKLIDYVKSMLDKEDA